MMMLNLLMLSRNSFFKNNILYIKRDSLTEKIKMNISYDIDYESALFNQQEADEAIKPVADLVISVTRESSAYSIMYYIMLLIKRNINHSAEKLINFEDDFSDYFDLILGNREIKQLDRSSPVRKAFSINENFFDAPSVTQYKRPKSNLYTLFIKKANDYIKIKIDSNAANTETKPIKYKSKGLSTAFLERLSSYAECIGDKHTVRAQMPKVNKECYVIDRDSIIPIGARILKVNNIAVENNSTSIESYVLKNKKGSEHKIVYLYQEKELVPSELIDKIKRKLSNSGAGRLLSSGRRKGTSISDLTSIISKFKDIKVKKLCYRYIEYIAIKIWGYKYPYISKKKQKDILKDYSITQSCIDDLCEKQILNKGACPKLSINPHIRLCWHLYHIHDRNTDVSMYKMPISNMTRLSVMDRLNAIRKSDFNIPK